MRLLGGERVRAGLPDLKRELVQRRGVEAGDAGERLAVGEAAVRAHQRVGMFGADLDMIAEHAIVADLEAGDAGLVAVARLERSDRAAAVARQAAQIV